MRSRILFLFVAVATVIGFAHAQDAPYSISLNGLYITSSRLFFQPHASDEILRNQHLPLSNILGLGVDVRRSLGNNGILIGLSAEYINKRDDFDEPTSSGMSIPVTDGFTAIPIELSGYVTIPVGSDIVRMYIGGGTGIYFGKRVYEKAYLRARTTKQELGYGIHVVSGVEVHLSSFIGIRSDLKFRDIQFESSTVFPQQSVLYNGSYITLDNTPTTSRVNIDGMTVSLGIVYFF